MTDAPGHGTAAIICPPVPVPEVVDAKVNCVEESTPDTVVGAIRPVTVVVRSNPGFELAVVTKVSPTISSTGSVVVTVAVAPSPVIETIVPELRQSFEVVNAKPPSAIEVRIGPSRLSTFPGGPFAILNDVSF